VLRGVAPGVLGMAEADARLEFDRTDSCEATERVGVTGDAGCNEPPMRSKVDDIAQVQKLI
jgi:hypothetical protein